MGSTGYSNWPSHDSAPSYTNGHNDYHTSNNASHHPRSIDDTMDGPNDNNNNNNNNNSYDQRPPPLTNDPSFDILEWHPAYQSCQRYFLDHAQHEPATQALCALINIRLPFQWLNTPVATATPSHAAAPGNSSFAFSPYQSRNSTSNLHSPNRSRDGARHPAPAFVALVPYIRRLVVTGFDKPPILHGFFGDDYVRGVLPHLDCERRNYLFAAKHGGWRSCKKQYDTGSGGGGDESVPFMKPLDAVKMAELTAAEKAWSGWLAMEDWMVGPRAPEDNASAGGGGGGRGASSGMRDRDELADADRLPDGVGDAFRSQ